MAESIAWITLDVQKTSAPVFVAIKQGDTGNRKIRITLSEGGFPYEIGQGCYAVLTAVKPDGNILYNHCDLEGNTIVYEVTEQTSAVAGSIPCEIRLYGPEDILLTTATFRIIVDGTIYSDAEVESASEFSALTHLISETTTVIADGKEITQQGQQLLRETEEARDGALLAAGNAETAANQADMAAQRVENTIQNAETAIQSAAAAAERAGAVLEEIRNVVDDGTDAPPIVCTATGAAVSLQDSGNRQLQGLKVFGKTVQDGTPTPEAPVELVSVGADGNVSVTVCGKNFVDLLNSDFRRLDMDGGTVSSEMHNEVTITGISKRTWASVRYHYYLPAGHYTVSLKMETDKGITNAMLLSAETLDGNFSNLLGELTSSGSKQFTLEKDCYVQFRLHFSSGTMPPDDEIWTTRYYDIQMERGSAATAYEPYKEAQTLPVSTPNGLPGIPVASGGNYTDENGQQWICDEVDFEKGVYVQRVGMTAFKDMLVSNWDSSGYVWGNNGLKNIGADYRSAHNTHFGTDASRPDYLPLNYVSMAYTGVYFKVDTEVYPTASDFDAFLHTLDGYVLYERATAMETGLSAEELAQYAALHTIYPNTTIYNDAGAGMEASYVADTKLYIDNKFNQLAAALVSST